MRLHGGISDDDDCVHSGSATGFSDGEREEFPATKLMSRMHTAYDPVTQILDKIDAELSSLTRSQGVRSEFTKEGKLLLVPENILSLFYSKMSDIFMVTTHFLPVIP